MKSISGTLKHGFSMSMTPSAWSTFLQMQDNPVESLLQNIPWFSTTSRTLMKSPSWQVLFVASLALRTSSGSTSSRSYSQPEFIPNNSFARRSIAHNFPLKPILLASPCTPPHSDWKRSLFRQKEAGLRKLIFVVAPACHASSRLCCAPPASGCC